MVVEIGFSLDSIITAVGNGPTARGDDHRVSVGRPDGFFLQAHLAASSLTTRPSRCLALSFLWSWVLTLIAEGFRHHVRRLHPTSSMAFFRSRGMININDAQAREDAGELHAPIVPQDGRE